MGIEYRIRLDPPDPSVAGRLRLQSGAAEESPGVLSFRESSPAGSMPDAVVHVEPDGLLFCDNGGAGRKFLGIVVAIVVGNGGSATIEEL
jgi:hypothetical protein